MSDARLDAPLALGPGETTWERDLAAGRIEGRSPPELLDPTSAIDFTWADAHGLRVRVSVWPRADGTFEAPLFPAGTADVAYRLRGGDRGTSAVLSIP